MPANERDSIVFPIHDWIARGSRHAQAENCDVLGFSRRFEDIYPHYLPREEVHSDETLHVAPELSRPVPNPSQTVVDRLEEVERHLTFMDHYAGQEHDVAEVDEIRAEKTSSTVTILVLRLGRLKQSSGALRRDKSVLRGLSYPILQGLHGTEDRGTRPQWIHLRRENRRTITLEEAYVEGRK